MMLRYRSVRTRRKNDVTVLELGPDGGNGKAPVLLVHPVNLRKECWLDLMRGLLGDRRCVAVDLAGHGESSDSVGYNLDGWVWDCLDVVTSLNLGRYHLVGGSLGGTIALCLAGELPARAMSVTMMCSSIRYESDPAAGPEPDVMLGTGTVGELFDLLSVQAPTPGSPVPLVATIRLLIRHLETAEPGGKPMVGGTVTFSGVGRNEGGAVACSASRRLPTPAASVRCDLHQGRRRRDRDSSRSSSSPTVQRSWACRHRPRAAHRLRSGPEPTVWQSLIRLRAVTSSVGARSRRGGRRGSQFAHLIDEPAQIGTIPTTTDEILEMAAR
ncbi:alpha/beta fold hydrolase [Micromonospora sp. WMMD1102]|uniref:alpha/beta fold hydrolase n=1 Tax=Micromonospora sp. WMMD1102 TaxID=3016105 RepID=UPI002414E4F1|nr:alpha/beta fold hydrolase [Micromonospora sp. WMMD1102]MDG4790632.1 alpha/beta fold hydrolase [Micromonospora sp. WMMD1102]